MNFAKVEEACLEHPTQAVCRALGVSRSGFYDYTQRQNRASTHRETAEARLSHAIQVAFDESRETYGRPRLQRVLAAEGHRIGANRLRKQMVQMGIYGKQRRRFKKTTMSEHDSPLAPNLLNQEFEVHAPNRVWCGDITYCEPGKAGSIWRL